MLRQVRE